jgi:4-amino-4-deoxy-L-arabinose transferase-like glycosyltransferase
MRRNVVISLIIAFVSCLLFIPFIGRLHLFDWDEINFAESAREMIVSKNYLTVQIFFHPFWEKPPLFIWLQVISMKLFGVNEFAARFPNAVCGIVTLVVLFNLGRKLINEKFGIIWTIAFGVSLLPFFYFKSGIIDPWFNLFIFSGITFYYLAQLEEINRKKYGKIALSAIFIGLAVLTKGPVAILVFGLTAFILLCFDKFRLKLKFGHVMLFALVLLFVGGFWFILMISNGNWQTVVDFFVYQVRLFRQEDAGHGGFPFYHFVILFFGVFPASVFAIHAHKKSNCYSEPVQIYRKVMLILFWVVLILFSIVQTKIVHYSSLCYFPLSFLAAYSVYSFISERKKIPRWLSIVQIVSISIISLAIIIFPIFDKFKIWFIERKFITQAFTIGNLQADPGWDLWVSLIGILLLAGGILSIIWLRKQRNLDGFRLLAITSAVFIYLTIIFITPGAEKYSQNAEIEFFKSLKGKNVYSQTFYKSYAMLFYTDALPSQNTKAYDMPWLLRGKIDKDVWMVIRADKKDKILRRYTELEVAYEKNGYVFCVRHKPLKPIIRYDKQ